MKLPKPTKEIYEKLKTIESQYVMKPIMSKETNLFRRTVKVYKWEECNNNDKPFIDQDIELIESNLKGLEGAVDELHNMDFDGLYIEPEYMYVCGNTLKLYIPKNTLIYNERNSDKNYRFFKGKSWKQQDKFALYLCFLEILCEVYTRPARNQTVMSLEIEVKKEEFKPLINTYVKKMKEVISSLGQNDDITAHNVNDYITIRNYMSIKF